MACGLQVHGQVVRQRASSPKLQVFNNALLGRWPWGGRHAGLAAPAAAALGPLGGERGGAELLARHLTHSSTQPLHPLLERWPARVDYVLAQGAGLLALEVKSGSTHRQCQRPGCLLPPIPPPARWCWARVACRWSCGLPPGSVLSQRSRHAAHHCPSLPASPRPLAHAGCRDAGVVAVVAVVADCGARPL